MKQEAFLSKQEVLQVEKFLYKAGVSMIFEREFEGLAELKQTMEQLEPIGADIITRKFLSKEADYTSHQAIYKELGLTYYTYKKHQLRALTKLGIELGMSSLAKESES